MTAAPWRATVLTIFPQMFPGPLAASLVGRALAEGRWRLEARDLRESATDRHRSVDDAPFGGGAGMVMRADIVARAIDAARDAGAPGPAIYLSPRGRRIDQALARELAAGPGFVALCGRFEGVDERVLEARDLLEVSVGDVVLSGGELPAMCLIDACVRLLPGVLGAATSLDEESFTGGLLEYPQFTRPALWEGRAVPEILISGDHARVHAWRRQAALDLTTRRRPDLLTSAPPRGP